jgi:WD40 repeat protein
LFLGEIGHGVVGPGWLELERAVWSSPVVVPDRVWRTADSTPLGEPLHGHRSVKAVAAGALPDGTPVIISGGHDGTARVWRTADATPLMHPLTLPESVQAVAIHGNVIITAAGADIAVHQPALPRPMR